MAFRLAIEVLRCLATFFSLFHHITVLADDFFAYFCAIIGGMQLLCVFNKERACSGKLEC